jgi:predicted acylesterase/phospholipase RssA
VNVRVKPRAMVVERDLPFEWIALVLKGGCGVSIGAINGATLAGKGHQRPQKCFPNLASFRQETSPLRLAVPPRRLWSGDQVLSAFSW